MPQPGALLLHEALSQRNATQPNPTPEFCFTTQHLPGGGVGLTPPPLRTRMSSWEKMKFAKGSIDLDYFFWYTNFWTFGFQTPSPPKAKLCPAPP